MIVKCPSWKKNIDLEATKCGYCQEFFLPEQKVIFKKQKKESNAIIGVIILIFLVIYLIPSPQKDDENNINQNNTQEQIQKQKNSFSIGEKKVIQKEKWIGAISEDIYKTAHSYILQKDFNAIDKLFSLNQIITLPKNKNAFIVNYHPFSELLEIRIEGSNNKLWTSKDIFE